MSASIASMARHREHARDHARDRRDDGEHDGEPQADVTEDGPRGRGQSEVPCLHDLADGELGADGQRDQQVEQNADHDRDDDGAADVLVGPRYLRPAVGDGREALVAQDAQRHSRQEATRTRPG